MGIPMHGFQGVFYPSTRQRCVFRTTYKSWTRPVTRQEASATVRFYPSAPWHFGYGNAVFARIGSTVIDAGRKIAHDSLTAAHFSRETGVNLDFMALCLQLIANRGRNAVLNFNIAAFEGYFGKS